MTITWIKPVLNWLKKGFCRGDEHGCAAEGNKTSSNVSCACFNNITCCGSNSTPAFYSPILKNKTLQCKARSKKDPAAQPKEESASSSSTQSKEGDEGPSSLLNSTSEKAPPSSESGSASFHSTLTDFFEWILLLDWSFGGVNRCALYVKRRTKSPLYWVGSSLALG